MGNKFLEQIFSVKNEDVHKCITIFGIKLHFKSKILELFKEQDIIKRQVISQNEILKQEMISQNEILKQEMISQNEILKQEMISQNEILRQELFETIQKLFAKPRFHNVTQLSREEANNKIIVFKADGSQEEVDEIPGLEVAFCGINSTLEVHEPYNFINCRISLGNNNYVKFGKSPYEICDILIDPPFADGSKLIIGDDFSCRSVQFYVHDEPNTTITIGDDVQLAAHILIWPSDGHCITDLDGNIINWGEDIVINDHCWIGTGARILKGSVVPPNSVIGMSSIFVKASTRDILPEDFDKGFVFGGIPAKPKKQGIRWTRANCPDWDRITKEKLANK